MNLFKKILNKVNIKRAKIKTKEFIKQLNQNDKIKKNNNSVINIIDNKKEINDIISNDYYEPIILKKCKVKVKKFNKIKSKEKIKKHNSDIFETDEQLITAFLLNHEINYLRKIKNISLIINLIEQNINMDLKLKCLGYLIVKEIVKKIIIVKDSIDIKYVYNKSENFNEFSNLNKINEKIEVNSSIVNIYKILSACDKLIILNINVSSHEIYHFIETMLLVELCMPLSKDTESMILSIAYSHIFCFKMLLNIYLKIKTAYLSRYFIIKFFDCTKIGNKGTVKLFKAKELFKLYKRTGNSTDLRNTIKAVRRLNKKEAREARFKISIYLEDYANALEYSNGINKFIALAELNIEYSLELLLHENRLQRIFGKNNKNVTIRQLFTLDANDENKIIIQLCKTSIKGLVPKKQYREKIISQYLEFVIELFCRLNRSPLKLFLFSQENYPNSLFLKLKIIRYLKHNYLNNALEYGSFIISLGFYDNPIFHLLIYEIVIIYRKLGMNFMKFLYWARRKMNVPLFSQEISYFEGKKYKYIKKCKEFDDNYSALYLAKEIIQKSCNNTGNCLKCRDKCKINSTNGDFIILRYFCDRNLAIKNIVDYLEITEGFYWKQLTGILEFEKKLNLGIKLISFDFGN